MMTEKEFVYACMDIIHAEIKKYVKEPGSVTVAAHIFDKLIPIIKKYYEPVSETEIEKMLDTLLGSFTTYQFYSDMDGMWPDKTIARRNFNENKQSIIKLFKTK